MLSDSYPSAYALDVFLNEALGDILGQMRQYMLANGIPNSQLGNLLKANSSQIKKARKLWTSSVNAS